MQIKQIETFEAPNIDILQNRVNKFLREEVKHSSVKVHYKQSVIFPKRDEYDDAGMIYTAMVEYNIETADEAVDDEETARAGREGGRLKPL